MICETDFFRSVLDNLGDGVFLVDRERRITYWNRGAEQLTGYRADEVIGSCCSTLLRTVDVQGGSVCDNSCLAAMTLADGKSREREMFMLSKSGHRHPMMVKAAPLFDDAGKIAGAVQIFSSNARRAMDLEMIAELKKLALIDALTGLGNRRFGEMTVHSRMDELRRYGLPFGLLFIDLDKFKQVNDVFGHEVGDETLRMVGRTLSNNVRDHDAICRWGGEEFVGVLSHLSDPAQFLSIAGKLRTLLDHSSIASGEEIIHVTISIGATLARPDDDEESVVKRADELMYRSKRRGGNVVSTDLGSRADGGK